MTDEKGRALDRAAMARNAGRAVAAYEKHQREARGLTAALEAYEAGIPSSLPDSNQYKKLVEAHRWGKHHAPHQDPRCPACA